MNLSHTFSCDSRAEEVTNVAKEILGDAYVGMQIQHIKFTENFELVTALLEAKLVEISNNQPKNRLIAGKGVGLVDACFDAMIKCYNKDFCSLDTISIVDFMVNAHTEHSTQRRSDAKVTARLHVSNSEEFEYAFECTTSSISHSSVAVVQESIAFFINAEMAYTRLHYALKDAEQRSRNDLVTRFQHQMSTLVHATSYEKLVQLLRSK